MQPQRFRTEKGAYVILVLVATLVFLALAGLAIDAGNLYLTKRELQTAADAAALSGANLLINEPVDLNGLNVVRDKSLRVMAENLRLSGYSPEQIQQVVTSSAGSMSSICFDRDLINPDGTCTDPTDPNKVGKFIAAHVRFDTPATLLGILPGFADTTAVRAAGSVNNLQLEVVLVLDSSGSMATTMNEPPPECGSNRSRLCALKNAAKILVSLLLPCDKVGIVRFSRQIETYDPNPYTYGTNQYWEVVDRNYMRDSEEVLEMKPLLEPGSQNRLDINAAIDGITASSQTNIGSGIRRGADTLHAEPLSENTLRLMLVVSDGAPTDYVPLAQIDSGPRRLYNHPLTNPPTQCATGHMPPLYGPDRHKHQRRYLDAVIEADEALAQGTLIYTVGLGFDSDMDDGMPSLFDQTTSTTDIDEEVLLMRIANDQSRMKAVNPVPGWVSPPLGEEPYHRDYPCVKTGQELKQYLAGKYEVANSGVALEAIFRDIAKIRSVLTD